MSSMIFTIHDEIKCEICTKPVQIIHGIRTCRECGFTDDGF